MDTMHTTSIRPWRNVILLFSFLFALPAAPLLFAEEGIQTESSPITPQWEWGEGWNEEEHKEWKEREEWEEGDSGEGEREWNEDGGNEEGEWDENAEEGAEGEEWLANLEANLENLDEETRRCVEEKIHAASARCEVSDIPGCAATVSMKKLVTEAQCGGEIFNVVEFEESGAGDTHDFQESFEEHREGGGGCVPFHATLEGVKAEMFGRAPEEILEEFERRKHWMAKMATEHGGNPEEMMKKFDGMPACEGGGPGEHQGPPMGMSGMMDPQGGVQNIGEIFGRAVGMLVELSQRPELNDEQKALVRETLSWFSDALNRIGAGEDAGPIAADARQKLEHLMETVGGGSFMGGPNIEMMRSEIEKMLTMVQMMIEKIPQAMTMMKEMGYEVEGWEPLYAEIKEQAAKVEEICRGKLSAASSPDQFRECFDAMHELFEKKMNGMGEYVGKSVPPEAMRKVEEEMGFDKMGMPGEHRGSPEGMEFRGMESPMGPPGGMHIPEEFKRIGQECLAQGRSEEECKKELERAMMDSLMKCDGETGGNAPECMGRFRNEFGLPPSEYSPSDGQ